MLRHLLATSFILGAALVGAAPALSQPAVPPPEPLPPGAAPGIPGSVAVNPAPGATTPYVGVGQQKFYDIRQWIDSVAGRIPSLPPRERARAERMMRTIRAEERDQIARHGTIRDWARESLTVKMKRLLAEFPQLGS